MRSPTSSRPIRGSWWIAYHGALAGLCCGLDRSPSSVRGYSVFPQCRLLLDQEQAENDPEPRQYFLLHSRSHQKHVQKPLLLGDRQGRILDGEENTSLP